VVRRARVEGGGNNGGREGEEGGVVANIERGMVWRGRKRGMKRGRIGVF